jgi:MFS family permease
MIVMAAFTSIVILGSWVPSTGNGAIIAFAILYGIGSGAGISLIPTLTAGISPIQEIGIRTGVSIAISSFASLTGSPIAGKIIADQYGDFKYAKVFAGVTCGIGTIFFILTRISAVGFGQRKA